MAILWSFGTKPPLTASKVFQVVRWTLQRNRRQCFPSVGNKLVTVVPVASTEIAVIVRPNTEMTKPDTGTAVVPSNGTVVVLSTGTAVVPCTETVVVPSIETVVGLSSAETPLDLEDTTTTERTYIMVHVNKSMKIWML